jgi:uncharacterized protein YbaR (Trm112 family)
MALDPTLLDILVCPVSHASLREIGESLVSTDPETRLQYRIDDGVPVMLIEEAEELSVEDWNAAMANG